MTVRLAVAAVAAADGGLDQADAVTNRLAGLDGQDEVTGVRENGDSPRFQEMGTVPFLAAPKMPFHCLAHHRPQFFFTHI